MIQAIYNPFKKFDFSNTKCFLSGEELPSTNELITVFPLWLMHRCELENKPFKLLDESITYYKELKVPCTPQIASENIASLEEHIQSAFMNGYEAVKSLPSLSLFQWISKLVYGVLFNEIQLALQHQRTSVEPFIFSQSLIHKFTNLHLMLQSLIRPIEFEGTLPWAIDIFPIQHSTDSFSYRDEINTLTFSLRMNDFGIIACLQDSGVNRVYHHKLLEKIANNTLHPIQFEELCGHFFYSNYLFNRLPEYTILPTSDAIYIEGMPLMGISNKPLFDPWQNKTYAQVLESFWKPWNITLFDIIKNPNSPISFLLDMEGNFKLLHTIELPY